MLAIAFTLGSVAPSAGAAEPLMGEEYAPVEEGVEEIRVFGVRGGRLRPDPSTFSSSLGLDDYRGEPIDVGALLSREAGVQIRRFGGPGDPTEISIRGSTAEQVAVQLDGVPLNSGLRGTANLSLLCTGFLESAELERGGGSVEEGSGAIGGVVRFHSRRPGTEPTVRARVSGGAFDTWQGDLFASGMAGALELDAGYCGFTTDGDYRFARPVIVSESGGVTRNDPATITRINNDRERHSGSLGLGASLARGVHFELRDFFTHSSHGEPGLDSGIGALGGQNEVARGRAIHNVASARLDIDDAGVFGDRLEALLYHRYERDRYEDAGSGETPIPTDLLTTVNDIGARLENEWAGEVFGLSHRLEIRADGGYQTLEQSDAPERRRGRAGLRVREEVGLWGERLRLVPAIRLDWTEGTDEIWLPRFGAVLEPWAWLRISGGVERSQRVPSFEELYHPDKGFIRGNPLLEPERATSSDVGLRLALDQLGPLRDFELGFGLFQQSIDDSIVWVTISPYTIAPINTGPARVRGLELSAALRVGRFLYVSGSHTEINARSVETGRRLVGRAESESHLRIEIADRQGWKLVGELQRTGSIPVSTSGNRVIAARSVWSLRAALDLYALPPLAGRAFGSSLWTFVAVDNVGDVAVRDALFFPQPGRSLQAGVEWTW